MSSLNQNEKNYDNKERNRSFGNSRINLNEIKLIQRTFANNTHEVL